MSQARAKSFNYAIGMFGTSIPINMLKTFAFTFYVLGLGVTTKQWAAMLFIYAFIDAIDNPFYGYLSDRTRSRWGRRRPWLVIGTPLLILTFIAFYNIPAFLAGESLLAHWIRSSMPTMLPCSPSCFLRMRSEQRPMPCGRLSSWWQ